MFFFRSWKKIIIGEKKSNLEFVELWKSAEWAGREIGAANHFDWGGGRGPRSEGGQSVEWGGGGAWDRGAAIQWWTRDGPEEKKIEKWREWPGRVRSITLKGRPHVGAVDQWWAAVRNQGDWRTPND